MRYAIARLNIQNREVAYRNYLTDGLFALVNGGLKLTRRYSDAQKPQEPEPVDDRTPEEIVAGIWAGMKGAKK